MSKIPSNPMLLNIKFYLFVILTILLSGCAQLGPDFMEGNRNEYNKVLANTNDEETLLNLVRRRYADSIAVLEVNSVSTSLEWKKNIGIFAKIFDGNVDDNNFGINGNGSYSEKPTITYLPLKGSDYVKNVLSPIKIDTILLLARSGWAIDRILLLTVNKINSINNASEASGPTPSLAPKYKDFKIIADRISDLQALDAFSFGYRVDGDPNSLALLLKPQHRDSEEVASFLKSINVKTKNTIIPIINKSSGQSTTDSIEINVRSLAGIQFFLSHGIIIPEDDLKNGRVQITKTPMGEPFDWNNVLSDLFVVYSSKDRPTDAVVSVQYRGYWFYIKDNDMDSKYTLMLLNQISALQSGKVEKAGPILTLPVSQ